VKLYEAMFLVDSAKAAADWTGIEDGIKRIMERVDAEIVSMKKWDERSLAYEVKGCNRGTYILCYFKADGARIRDIERDVQLSEQFMRVLILSAEGRAADVEKETPAMKAEREIREKREAAEAKVAEAAEAAQAEQRAGKAGSEVEAEVSESSQTPDVSETAEEPETGDAEVPATAEPEAVEAAPVEAEVLQEQTEEEDKKPSAGEEVSP